MQRCVADILVREGKYMKFATYIVDAYLRGEGIDDFRSEWYFTESSLAKNQGKNIFTEPAYDEAYKEKVKTVYAAIQSVAKNFIPTSLPVWDMLFPEWRQSLADVHIDLIMGFPEPYDATVEYDRNGMCHIVFDIPCWTKYVGKHDIAKIAQNLLTHELCHVVIGASIPAIDTDTESEDYLTALDAVTFHEGFAHLVSYEGTDIDKVDWHAEHLEETRKKCRARMKAALTEKNPEHQKNFLKEGQCGRFYEKFICMSGMLYLADIWEMGGNQALKKCFDESYHGFAEKTVTFAG